MSSVAGCRWTAFSEVLGFEHAHTLGEVGCRWTAFSEVLG